MKIYTAVYRNWYPNYAWFGRDSGLVTEGLRRIGVESRMVILDTPGMPEDERFLAAPRAKFLEKEFWKSLQLDAVILQGGGEAGCEPVADAVKASGTKLLLRMDSDGVADPAVDLRLFTYGKWWGFGNVHRCRLRLALWENSADAPWWKVLFKDTAARRSAAHLAACQVVRFGAVPAIIGLKLLFPSRFGAARLARRISKGDAILVESKLAAARLERLLSDNRLRNAERRLLVLPIPVSEDSPLNPAEMRENIVFFVARLYDDQKDVKLFMRLMSRFLAYRPDYKAVVIGDGNRYAERSRAKYAQAVSDRILIFGRSGGDFIRDWEQRGRIFVCTSRGEGFPNAIAEAVCRGCSIVGPDNIAALSFYDFEPCVTVARSRRVGDLLDALLAEASEWDAGRRDPVCIALAGREKLLPEKIADQILKFLKTHEETRGIS